MSDNLDFIAELEDRFFANRSVDILDIIPHSSLSTEKVCLAIEVLFQLREYDFNWLNEQLLRSDLGLNPSAIDSIVRSVFTTAVEFRRSFLGSKLSHLVQGTLTISLKGPNDLVAIGEKVDDLTLLDRIASGGILTTYRGYREDGSSFAVRVPNVVPETTREAVWSRLRDEFQVLEKLSSQGIKGIARQLKWLESSYGPVAISEFIDGEVLAEIPRSRISQEAALKIVEMVSTTVGEIHSLGFIHGDVKPENIIVTPDGKAILLDLNTVLPSDISEIDSDRFSGTLNYMSIESLAGGSSEVSIQRDIHAIGALLYELLEHKPLTDGARKEDVFVAQAVNLRSMEDRFTEKTPTALRSVIKFATNLDPDLRFDSCSDLVDALNQSRQNPDSDITVKRDPIAVAFRLGLGTGEIEYAINETLALVAELEENGIAAKLNFEQQMRLLGIVAISEESRVVVSLAKELGIELQDVDGDGYFIRLPMTWTTRPPKTYDEFRSQLESALRAVLQMKAILQASFLESKQACALQLGCLISGEFAEPQFEQLKNQFQGKLKPAIFNEVLVVIEKTSKSSRRKRLQALANLLKPSLSQTIIG